VEVELGKDGRTVCLEWDRGRLFDHETACLFETIVKEGTHVSVTSVKESETSRPRPTALDTVEMLKIASRALGMGPAQAMSAAERLYLSGYMSYPRTESTQYPDSFDLEGTVSEQCRSPYWGSYAATLLATGLQRPKKGVDAGDHPPITPVRSAAPGELVGDMERLYDMITRHFLATGMCWPIKCAVFLFVQSVPLFRAVSADAVYATTKATFDINGETFSVSGKRMIVPGFTEVMTLFSKDDVILPIFTKVRVILTHPSVFASR
jgi:DNA topoisomerase-3